MPPTPPGGLEHVPCKGQRWSTREPRLHCCKTGPNSLLIPLLTSCPKELHSTLEIHHWWTKDNLLKNKWHLLFYRNKKPKETGLKYQRKTLMCCSRNLPRCLDLIFTTALETSSLLEYCNSQNQLPEQSGQSEPGASACQRALCPGSFRRFLTVNKRCSWAVSSLFMTKRSPRESCLNLFQPESSHCDSRTTQQPLLIQAEELPTTHWSTGAFPKLLGVPVFCNSTSSGSVQHILTA